MKNRGGGASVYFYGRMCRDSGVPLEVYSQPITWESVKKFLIAIANRDVIGHQEDRYLRESAGEEALPYATERALRLLGTEHASCFSCDVSYWTNPRAVWENTEFCIYDTISQAEFLADDLCKTQELFLDFVCALVQTNPRDVSKDYDALGMTYTPGQENKLIKVIQEELLPMGFHLVDGVACEISTKIIRTVRNANVGKILANADLEISNRCFADAITDLGSALQLAFKNVGITGNTLGEQLTAARKKEFFQKENSKVIEAVTSLTFWAAAIRNNKSDAHPNAAPTYAETILMQGIVRALIMYLDEYSRALK